MSRLRNFALTAGILACSPALLSAQSTATVHLTAPNAPGGSPVISPNGAYYESPYTALVNGVQTRVNCVDFFNDVVLGEIWTATDVNLGEAASNLALLAFTRNGNLASALQMYEQVAWLTEQYTADPASDKARTIAIQTAIWAIANTQGTWNFLALDPPQWAGSLNTTASNTDPTTTGYWMREAKNQYAALEGTGYYDKFHILTDVNVANPAACVNDPTKSYTCTAQEFMYSTPEPGSLLLLGTGLAGVVGGARRRRKGRARVQQRDVAA